MNCEHGCLKSILVSLLVINVFWNFLPNCFFGLGGRSNLPLPSMPNVLPNVPHMIPSVLCHIFVVFSCLEKINFNVLQCVSKCHPMCFLTPFTYFSSLPSLSIPSTTPSSKKKTFFLDVNSFIPYHHLMCLSMLPIVPQHHGPLSFQKNNIDIPFYCS